MNRITSQKQKNSDNPTNNKDKEKPSCNNKKEFFKIPYISGLSESLYGILNSNNSTIALYNNKITRNIFSKLKDKTPNFHKSNVIYKIPCNNCDRIYVGQTKQLLQKRIYNHKRDCYHYNQNKKEKTALAGHHFDTGHVFDFNNTVILDHESNYQKRLFLEMVHINREKQAVNLKSDVQDLNKSYFNLLNNYL